jgi:hypothetical protein
MRRHRRYLEFPCPPLIIIGISLAPGCSSKCEANKFIFLAEGLEFFQRILVYLDVDVHSAIAPIALDEPSRRVKHGRALL